MAELLGDAAMTEATREQEKRDQLQAMRKKLLDDAAMREQLLPDAAMRGDLELLHQIIEEDKYILEKVVVGCFKGKNPLHVAISTGQVKFVLELLKHKPDLVEVSDADLGAPLHIASSQGYLTIAEVLVMFSPGMCMARDREGNNPLHIAAMKGNVQVLKVLLETSPHAARVKVDRGDTILHLCVNYNQLESLRLLLKMVGDKEFVNSIDTNGNNILHLAVFGKRREIIDLVLTESKIDVNARNGNGWTALDIHYRLKKIALSDSVVSVPKKEKKDSVVRGDDYDPISDILRNNGAKRCEQLFLPFEPSWEKKKKETLMVVSSLIATIAFQVGVNPPGGVWAENAPDHVAGKAITAYNYPNAYLYFMYFNTVGFLLSLTTILELIVALPAKHQFSRFIRSIISWMTIMAIAFAYTFSVIVVTPKDKYEKPISLAILVIIVVWAFVLSFINLAPYKVRVIVLRVLRLLWVLDWVRGLIQKL